MSAVSYFFPDFNFDWLVEETKKNLPLELDFEHEGENAERVAAMFKQFPWLKVSSCVSTFYTNDISTYFLVFSPFCSVFHLEPLGKISFFYTIAFLGLNTLAYYV